MVLVFASLLAGSPAVAQQTEARIAGTISDQNGGVLPGVTVTVTSSATGAARTAVTDEQGRYTITNLPPGTYTVAAELSGFGASKQDVSVGLGDRKTVDASLQVAGLTESVTVAAAASTMDLTSARIGVNVSPEEIEQLPVNGRNFANLMTLATGATSDGNGGWASVRFNGKSNQQNYLNYDGVDGTYVWDASPGYLNATGSQFRLQTSMESIAEFRVNSGLAPAESGLGSGGNITVISKSGANRFSGSLFEFLRNDALDSASKYDDKKQELEFNQFGGSLGGPIVSNRTFFFGSYEGLRQTTGLSFTEAVPSDEAIRRIMAGEPVGSGGGQSADRTKAVAPLLAGFPRGTVPTANAFLALATLNTEAEQREDTASFRLDHRFTNNQSFYARLLYSDGRVDTPDRTVTPRRVLATQHPMNFVANHQSIFGASVVNELKIGFNRPQYDANAFGPSGYDPTQVSLSGTVTSQSIDARGTTGIARSGLLVRATSNASTNGQAYDPRSISLSDAMTITRGGHTFKLGGEYRNIASKFQFLGSTEITYNSINAFIDNTPAQVAVALDSPFFTPQQFYAIGFAQDTWRVNSRLTLELGLRYDFYSVVKEKDNLSKPFFIEDNAFAANDAPFYNSDKNNFAPRLSAVYQVTPKTALRAGYGHFYGPGQFEDRIQPIENYIERRRVQSTDVPVLAYPVDPSVYRNLLSVRGYTHDRPDEYNVQYRREHRAGVVLRAQPVRRLHGQPRQGHVPARRRQHLRQHHPPASGALGGTGRLQDVGLRRRAGHQRQPPQRLRKSELRRAADRPHAPLPQRSLGRPPVPVFAQRGHDPGLERGGNGVEHLRLQHGVRHQPDRPAALVQRLAGLHAAVQRANRRRLACRRHPQRQVRRPHQRHHRAPGHRRGGRRDRDQHSRRQLARHAAAGSRRRREPLPEGRCPLVEPRGVRGADARHVRQPPAQLPARAGASGSWT